MPADAATDVVVVLFPDVTQLDFTGPVQVLVRVPGVRLHFASATPEPIMTDSGFAVVPTCTFADAPQADVLFVPGGRGAFDAIVDDSVVGFVGRQAADARYVRSVCTGSFVLGAAGLLEGRRATSHWGSRDLLARLGATVSDDRVVIDGSVITGAGVSSGIDFALRLAEELSDRETAQQIQLYIEYDPDPPYDTGSADRAPKEWVDSWRADARSTREPLVSQAAERLRRTS